MQRFISMQLVEFERNFVETPQPAAKAAQLSAGSFLEFFAVSQPFR